MNAGVAKDARDASWGDRWHLHVGGAERGGGAVYFNLPWRLSFSRLMGVEPSRAVAGNAEPAKIFNAGELQRRQAQERRASSTAFNRHGSR